LKKALIIFARLPRPGEVKTRLGKTMGMGRAAALYQELAERTFTAADTVQAGAVNVYLFFEPPESRDEITRWINRPFAFVAQTGATLGERMRKAFEIAFADRASATIIIGTDIPELEAGIIEQAFNLLRGHDIVVGPSTDGGYYLLGMNAPATDLFDGIAWSTGDVLSQTLRKARSMRLTYALLPELADIDTEEDYNAYLSRVANTKAQKT
jgi:uncharacterized protein